MTKEEAAQLKVGDLVVFEGSSDIGKVVRTGRHFVSIEWPNKELGDVDTRGCAKISRAPIVADPIPSGLEKTLTRNLIKFAVGRAIFCPDCDKVLDYKRAVLVEAPRGDGIICTSCWDDGPAKKFTPEQIEKSGIKVLDGRLYK